MEKCKMEKLTSDDLRAMYIRFFTERGHQEIASASLFPENDASVLFTTAGMHPLVPYLLGENHPRGKRLVDVQKCLRTDDIDEVGDDTHLTFFEMLGNWSLGDYFKEESISMSHAFLTRELGIPAEKLVVTVFEGDDEVPADVESKEIWMRNGLREDQIFAYGRKENWWGPAGQTGPCGPDTEIFYDMGVPKCGDGCGPACHCGKYVEIWNNVFMEYNQAVDGSFTVLPQRNVDTGMGLERVLIALNGYRNVYETDLFRPLVKELETLSGATCEGEQERTFRIICEHMRASTFLLGDPRAVAPSNGEQGYILRRLIRRTVRMARKLGVRENILNRLAEVVIGQYGGVYPELVHNRAFILEQLDREYGLFSRTLDSGLKMAEKVFADLDETLTLSGEQAFRLYDTFGFPIEITTELASERGIRVELAEFEQKYREHQEKSRKGAEAKFKGGLADNGERTTRLHTATHLLNGALRAVLGEEVWQRGSNITSERLRFDFTFDRKMTADEIREVEKRVNEAIAAAIPVECKEMTVDAARLEGAVGVFDAKYGETVKVYVIPGYSMEICGGPHAGNTAELKSFRIEKEESSSAGVRRIKATIGG